MDQEKIISAIHLYREVQRHEIEAKIAESKLEIIVESMTEEECGQYTKSVAILNSVKR